VHFRRTTRGATDATNIHPFVLHGRFGLMHNGTLPSMLVDAKVGTGRSDTAIFAEEVLAKLSADELTNHTLWHVISHAVDKNRMVMLDGETGFTYFANAHCWRTGLDGVLLSNNYAIQRGELWGLEVAGPTQPAHFPSQRASPVATTLDVVKSVAISSAIQRGVELVPIAPAAWEHPLMDVATSVITRMMMRFALPRTVFASTLVLSFLHAGRFTADSVKQATLDELYAELMNMIRFFNPLPASADDGQRELAFFDRAAEMCKRFSTPAALPVVASY
jgi:hypothetical protein